MPYERDRRIPLNTPVETFITIPKRIGTVSDPKLDAFYRDHERMGWSLSAFGDGLYAAFDPKFASDKRSKNQDFNPPAFRPDLVTQGEVDSLTHSMLVESHNPVYVATLNSYPSNRMNIRDTDFLAVWGYEEWRHFRGSLMYLEALAQAGEISKDAPHVDIEGISEKLEQTRAGTYGDSVDESTKVQVYGYTMLQELFTNHHYRYSAKHTKDPMLKDLYGKMGRDEMRHHQWYFDRTYELLHPDPENPTKVDSKTFEEFTEMLMGFEMPGSSFISDATTHNPQYVEDAGNPNSELGRLLVGKIDQLIGKDRVDDLLGRKNFRKSLENRGISSRTLFAYRMTRKLHVGR